MTKKEAERIIHILEEHERYDLIMYLAEQFDFRVHSAGKDITFFLATE